MAPSVRLRISCHGAGRQGRITGTQQPAFDRLNQPSDAFLTSYMFGRLALSQAACPSHDSRWGSGAPPSSTHRAIVVARAEQPPTVQVASYPH